ncbi:MAG: DUF3347 domain-containing protein [Candidatus Cloacimonetes bacterium]|nr:DUF3347 domain-containing protein [Candidatus Cloacimonadota bacterium]
MRNLVFVLLTSMFLNSSIMAQKLTETLKGYFAIQTALAADEFETARTSAQNLLISLEEQENQDKILNILNDYIKAEQIADARVSFYDLSQALISLLKEESPDSYENIFLAHCPMARKGKGAYWLQDSNAVANPYYGASMLRCGNTKPFSK